MRHLLLTARPLAQDIKKQDFIITIIIMRAI